MADDRSEEQASPVVRVQPKRKCRENSEAPPPKKRTLNRGKFPLLKLPDEILLQIFSHHPRGPGPLAQGQYGNPMLWNLSLVNKRLHGIINTMRYSELNVRAAYTSNRSRENIELLTRSLLRNPELRPNVKILNFMMGLRTNLGRSAKENYATPAKFWNTRDFQLLKEFLEKICQLPIWKEFPAGKWLPDSQQRTTMTSTVSPEWRAAKWFMDVTTGQQAAVVALLMALCPKLQDVRFQNYHLLMEGGVRAANDEDPDWTSSLFRGGANSQALKLALPPAERDNFADGVLLNLKTVQLDDMGKLQHANVVVPVLALPQLARAQLSILDNSLPVQIFSPPDDLAIAFKLQELVLIESHVDTNSLVNIIKCCRQLKVFVCAYAIKPNYESTNYNHHRVIAALGEAVGKTLRVLILGYNYADEWSDLADGNAGHREWLKLCRSLNNELKVSSWQQFQSLIRLQIPIDFVLGWKNDRLFTQNAGDAAQLANWTNLEVELADQLPSKLETLEIMWPQLYLRFTQIFPQLTNLIRRRDEDGVPMLKTIFLGDVIGEVNAATGKQQPVQRCKDMLDLAKKKGVKVCQYAPQECRLPREPGGPREEVHMDWDSGVIEWT